MKKIVSLILCFAVVFSVIPTFVNATTYTDWGIIDSFENLDTSCVYTGHNKSAPSTLSSSSVAPNGGLRWVELHVDHYTQGSSDYELFNSSNGYGDAPDGRNFLKLGAPDRHNEIYSDLVYAHWAKIHYQEAMDLRSADAISFYLRFDGGAKHFYPDVTLSIGFNDDYESEMEDVSCTFSLDNLGGCIEGYHQLPKSEWVEVVIPKSRFTGEPVKWGNIVTIAFRINVGSSQVVRTWGITYLLIDKISAKGYKNDSVVLTANNEKRIFSKNVDYYTTKWNSSVYSPTFANMLAVLCELAYNEEKITKAYQTLGFTQAFSTHYETNLGGVYDPDYCAYTVGFKRSEYNNELICLITVCGSRKIADWIYNFDIMTDDEKHIGFVTPANIIRDKVVGILTNNGLSIGNVKYVITGHSRGGAVGNLLSVDLMERGVKATNIYNYNFACPDVACKSEFPVYNNIHNLCNTYDVVPFVPGILNSLVSDGKSWGKYGDTYWFTKYPDEKGLVKGHDMSLYLDFFDRRLAYADWPYEEQSADLGMLIKVFCPVDVIVTDGNDKFIASVVDGEITYGEGVDNEIIIFTSGDKKIIYSSENEKFHVDLIGTDSGTMTFSVEKVNLITGEVIEGKTFGDVVLEKGKKMYSQATDVESVSDIALFATEEKDGDEIITHVIGTDGAEARVVNRGDVDCQDGVTANDALITLQVSVNKATFTGEQIAVADVDGTLGVTTSDALLILQKAVNKIDKFPVE